MSSPTAGRPARLSNGTSRGFVISATTPRRDGEDILWFLGRFVPIP